MRGKGPLELVKKSAADLRAMCANMEHPVANAPKTEDGGAQPCDDAKSTGAKSCSTVARFCNDSGGARKALQRYIAGFASRDTTVLGTQPPCAKYQSLRLLIEFDTYPSLVTKVTTKQQLATLSQEWKPFRCALAELHTMLKAALNRTRKAVEVQAKLHQTETK